LRSRWKSPWRELMSWAFRRRKRRSVTVREEKITFSQFAAAAAVSAFSPISRLLPKSALEVAGKSAWVAPLLSFLPLLLLCTILKGLLRDEECGLCGALESALGKWAGRVIAVILGAWVIFYGGFLIRSGAERYISTVYKDEKLWVFIFTIALVALVGALGSVRSISRMAQICAAIVGSTMVILLMLGLPDMERYYLLPVNALDAGRIGASMLPVFNVATSWVLLTFLSGYVRPGSRCRGSILRWSAYIIMLMLVVIVATVGVLGPEMSESQQYPFFVLISNLKVFNIFERIEPVTVMIWVLTDFVFVAMLMMSAGEVGRNVTGCRSRALPVFVSAAAMIAVAFVITKSAFEFVFVSYKLIPIVNLVVAAFFMPMLAIIKKLKKDKKRC